VSVHVRTEKQMKTAKGDPVPRTERTEDVPMLADARRTAIVATVARERVVRVSDLAEQFGVSLVTVRRDIEALDDAGLVQKIHGGAKVPGGAGTHEPGFELKSTLGTLEKQAIAKEAVLLVRDGMAIGLSAGTTTWALAKELSSRANLTVVTNSVKIADVFQAAASRVSVILTGGERTPSDALVGPIATQSVRSLHLDVLFLGVHGVDQDAGFTTPNLLEAEMDRALIDAARRVVVLADHSKWGTVGISTIAAMEEVDEVISDDQLGHEAQRVLRERVGSLRLVRTTAHPLAS
jgi:DeoR family fructose operon transcriptional repressor